MGIKIGQAKEIEMEEAIAFLHEHDHFLWQDMNILTEMMWVRFVPFTMFLYPWGKLRI